MKQLIIVLLGFILVMCNSDENERVNNPEAASTLVYTLKNKFDPSHPLSIRKYFFDIEGKVISVLYINPRSPQSTYYKVYEYNSKGQVTKEMSDGQTIYNILWTNEVAEIFFSENMYKVAEYRFEGDNLIEYTRGERTKKFNYDSDNNLVSIEDENGIFVEFLEYRTERNPFNLIKSIGILQFDDMPFVRNIFSVEKAYPYEDDDYGFPLTYYKYRYKFNGYNKVY